MTFPAYPVYRHSGVDWLGVVPEYWDVKQLRYLGRFRKGLTITKANLTDTGIPCLNYGEVHSLYPFEVNQDIHPLKSVPAKYLETDPSACVKYGDFVFADTSEDLDGVGNFTHVSGMEPLFAGYHTIIYSLNSEVSSRFLAYCLESFAFRTQLRKGVKGVKVFSVTQEILRGGIAWLPTRAEQPQIARFLDYETARIDALIEEQHHLIELLKEKRQAVISFSVTKGLDPTVMMKNSGLEWLGDVPVHWPLPKLGHLARVLNGSTPSRENMDYWSEGDIPWIASGSLNDYRIDLASEFITKKALKECSVEMIPSGAILVGLVGQGKTRGLAALLNIEATINQNVCAVVPDKEKVLSSFLHLYLHSIYEPLRDFGRGANQAALNCELVSALRIPLPCIEEQRRIVKYIESKLNEFDALEDYAQRSISLMQERRSALISAAVTGKIDVRGWQAPVRAPSPELEEAE